MSKEQSKKDVSRKLSEAEIRKARGEKEFDVQARIKRRKAQRNGLSRAEARAERLERCAIWDRFEQVARS